jgi:hypothetical protein
MVLGYLNQGEENLFRQVLGTQVNLFDSLSVDPKLNLLREALLADHGWI